MPVRPIGHREAPEIVGASAADVRQEAARSEARATGRSETELRPPGGRRCRSGALWYGACRLEDPASRWTGLTGNMESIRIGER
jgi:hypothetical protein